MRAQRAWALALQVAQLRGCILPGMLLICNQEVAHENIPRRGKGFFRAHRGNESGALSDFAEFGSWCGMRFDGPFVPGAYTRESVWRDEVLIRDAR